jgi:hypothetical protein
MHLQIARQAHECRGGVTTTILPPQRLQLFDEFLPPAFQVRAEFSLQQPLRKRSRVNALARHDGIQQLIGLETLVNEVLLLRIAALGELLGPERMISRPAVTEIG